jgi:hypothetical protein
LFPNIPGMKQVVLGLRVVWVKSHTDTGGYLQSLTVISDEGLCQGGQNSFRHSQGVFGASEVGQEHHELIAAKARSGVVVAQAVG